MSGYYIVFKFPSNSPWFYSSIGIKHVILDIFLKKYSTTENKNSTLELIAHGCTKPIHS
jgi:hypothetical protein